MKYIKKDKVLDPKQVDDAIAEVNHLADAEAVRIALCGGVAMMLYGSPRFTSDIDFVADDYLASLPGTELSFGGTRSRLTNGVIADIIVRSDDEASLYEAALDAAVDLDGGGLVIPPEFLAAMKFSAARPKDELDLEFLVTSEQLDLDRLRKILREHLGKYAVKDFDRVLEEIAWKTTRGTK